MVMSSQTAAVLVDRVADPPPPVVGFLGKPESVSYCEVS